MDAVRITRRRVVRDGVAAAFAASAVTLLDVEGARASALTPTWRLAAPTAPGDPVLLVDADLPGFAPDQGLVVVDPWTANAELRAPIAVTSTAITVAPLSYAHAAGTPVLLWSGGPIPWTLWGAKGGGSTADATANVTAFNRLSQEMASLGPDRGPLAIFVPVGRFFVNGELKPGAGQSLVGVSPVVSQIAAAPDFPFDASGEIAIYHPHVAGVPVSYGTGGTGSCPIANVAVDGANVANANGILASPARGDVWENVRVENCKGLYGICVTGSGGHAMRNLMLAGNTVSLRIRSSQLLAVYDLNIEKIPAGSAGVVVEANATGAAPRSCSFHGIHIEDNAAVTHFRVDRGTGFAFDNYYATNNGGSTGFRFNVQPDGRKPRYAIRGGEFNGGTAGAIAIDDATRGWTIPISAFLDGPDYLIDEFLPGPLHAGWTDGGGGLVTGGGARVAAVLSAVKAWDLPRTNDAAVVTTTVPVPGATVLNSVARASLSSTGGSWLLSASVTAPGTVTVVAMNKSGARVDPASGTLRVVVEQL